MGRRCLHDHRLDPLANRVLLLRHSISSRSGCHSTRSWLSVLRLSRERGVEIHSVGHRMHGHRGRKFRLSSNADSGAVFVFGKTYQDHFFVFKVEPLARSSVQFVTLSIEGHVDHHLPRIGHQRPVLSRCDAVYHRQDRLAHATLFEYNGSRGNGRGLTARERVGKSSLPSR